MPNEIAQLRMALDEAKNSVRVVENQRDLLAAEIATTIETIVRGDELPVAEGTDPAKPPDPNPLQSVIDRLRGTLALLEKEMRGGDERAEG